MPQNEDSKVDVNVVAPSSDAGAYFSDMPPARLCVYAGGRLFVLGGQQPQTSRRIFLFVCVYWGYNNHSHLAESCYLDTPARVRADG